MQVRPTKPRGRTRAGSDRVRPKTAVPQPKKWYSRFSRTQKLGAATAAVCAVFLLMLLRENPPPAPAVPKLSIVQQAPLAQANNEGNKFAQEAPLVAGTNRPPSVTSLQLSPAIVFPGEIVRAEVSATDPDEDPVMLSYEWKMNGVTVGDQKGEEFDTAGLRKGDLLVVSVTPTDGKEEGNVRESHGIVIQNRPPEITSQPSAGVTSGIFQYQVTAADADGDELTYSLEQAPQGMRIDSSTGAIQWDVPQGLQGKQQVRVEVSDGSAKAFQAFNLNLGMVANQ